MLAQCIGQIIDSYNYGSVAAAQVASLLRGNVTITSTDTNVALVINPNWLTHPVDVKVALATFKRTRQVWAPLNITIGDECLPGPNVTNDADILNFIRNSAVQV